MQNLASAYELSSCDREPINTPGAIQSHGILVVVRASDHRVEEISANAEEVFGRSAEGLLGVRLPSLMGRRGTAQLAKHVKRGLSNALQPVTLVLPSRLGEKRQKQRWDVFVHRQGDDLVLEFEKSEPKSKSSSHYRQLRLTLGRVHAAPTLQQLCERAARAVRMITRYDLVMVYRFDADWNGEVIAESKCQDVNTYLRHHFPASDIPKQAREAFRSNWVRTIPDVGYKPVPVLQSKGRQPLNMAKSLLRSVSPIHLQYLKNMGTQATLTITLLSEGKLWGLIACHHATPNLLFHETRLACELVGKTLSSLIEPRHRSEEDASERLLAEQRRLLIQSVEAAESVRDGIESNGEALLASVNAEGAAVRVDDDKPWLLLGKTPELEQVDRLAQWLQKRMSNQATFSTSHLAREYPSGKGVRKRASGLLAVSIPKTEKDFILWFRPEEVHDKVWAGDPNKQVARLPDGSVKIEPRQSFEGWKESVTLRARPWSRVEAASAMAVRNDIMAQDLRRQFKLAQEAIRARDEFLSIASHELKTPLTTMRLQTQMTRRRLNQGGQELKLPLLQRAMSRIDGGIDRLARLVDDMLDISRISTGKLAIAPVEAELTALAHDVVERVQDQFETNGVPLELRTGQRAEGMWDGLRIEQVLWNLLSNALRYGKGSPVRVWAGQSEGAALLEVQDGGPGVAPENQARIFHKFERAAAKQEVSGLGLGLHICKSIIELHGGRIGVRSSPGTGTTFWVVLPLKA